MFKFPVYLKFHNNGNQNITTQDYQYNLWSSIFDKADIKIICEDNSVNKNFCNHEIIPKISTFSEKNWQKNIINALSDRWKNAGYANLTPTVLTSSEYYWIIDADDINILLKDNNDKKYFTECLKQVEDICLTEKLNFCNYDLNYSYHHLRSINSLHKINWGHPSFGISLIKNSDFYDIFNIEVKTEGWGINQDTLLEVVHNVQNNSKTFSISDIIVEQYNFGHEIQHRLLFHKNKLSYVNCLQLEKNNLENRSSIIF